MDNPKELVRKLFVATQDEHLVWTERTDILQPSEEDHRIARFESELNGVRLCLVLHSWHYSKGKSHEGWAVADIELRMESELGTTLVPLTDFSYQCAKGIVQATRALPSKKQERALLQGLSEATNV